MYITTYWDEIKAIIRARASNFPFSSCWCTNTSGGYAKYITIRLGNSTGLDMYIVYVFNVIIYTLHCIVLFWVLIQQLIFKIETKFKSKKKHIFILIRKEIFKELVASLYFIFCTQNKFFLKIIHLIFEKKCFLIRTFSSWYDVVN